MFERFSNHARRAVIVAETAARRRGAAQIEVKHLLFGFLAADESVASRSMGRLGVTADTLMPLIGEPAEVPSGDESLPFSEPVRNAMSVALTEAIELDSNYIYTGHLLLGLTKVDPGIATVLAELGVDQQTLREATLSELSECVTSTRGVPAPDAERRPGHGLFELFTDRARHAVVDAQKEARGLGHGFVGAEHLLLGLLCVDDGVASQFLQSRNVMLESARREVARLIGAGSVHTPGTRPFTPKAKKALDRAVHESDVLSDIGVHTEHLLLSLTKISPVVAKVLQSHHVDPSGIPAALVEFRAMQ